MTRSMIDVRRFADRHGVAGVLSEFQDDAGTDGSSLRVLGGDAAGWRLLETAAPDWPALEATFALCPAVLVGVVRGTCRGLAARLAGELDLLYGVSPVDADDGVEFIEIGTAKEIERSIIELESEIRTLGLPAAVTAMVLRGGVNRSPSNGLLAEALAYSMLQTGERFADWKEARHAGP